MTEALGTARFGPSGSAAGEDMAQTMSIAGAGRARVNPERVSRHTSAGRAATGRPLACDCVVRIVVVESAAKRNTQIARRAEKSESPQRDWFDRDTITSNESNVVDD